MISGVISFLGGTAFRWLFGELIGFFKARQEHAQELERMRLSLDQEAQRHRWQQEAIAAQAAAGISVVEAQAEAASSSASDAAFLAAVQGVGAAASAAGDAAKRGDWIGKFAAFAVALNAFIRPELAQVSIILLAASAIWPSAIVLTGIVGDVVCASLGIFVGERIRLHGK